MTRLLFLNCLLLLFLAIISFPYSLSMGLFLRKIISRILEGSIILYTKMYVTAEAVSCVSCFCNVLSLEDLITAVNQNGAIMCIIRLYSVLVIYDDQISITAHRTCVDNRSSVGSKNIITGSAAHVDSLMLAAPSPFEFGCYGIGSIICRPDERSC